MIYWCSQWTVRLLVQKHRPRLRGFLLQTPRSAIQSMTTREVSSPHAVSAVRAENEAEEGAIREEEVGEGGLVREVVVGRGTKRWGEQNGGV